jgi:signal transduction histidine kinase
MRQVFINLLMNAVDAMDGHGGLTITTYLDDDGWRAAEVSDTGPGIDPEQVRRIFDPFFTTKEVGKGTGLGLSVVYGVVQRHGGEISVKETSPRGATLLFRLAPDAPREFIVAQGVDGDTP